MERYVRYRGEDKKRPSAITSLFDVIMLLVTIFFAIAMICAYLAKYVHPEHIWFFSFAGLGAPFLYLANILLLLFWIVRWRIFVLIPMLVLLVGIGNVSMFFRPAGNGKPDKAEGKKVTFMTYNVMGFLDEDADGEMFSVLDSTVARIREIDPDILCMQEFQATPNNPKTRIDALLDMPYNKAHYRLRNSSGGGWGIAVYSKYPIIDYSVLEYEGSQNASMWVDLRIGKDTVRIFNNHLQTTSVSREDRNYIDSQEFLENGPHREDKVRNIASKLRRGFWARAQQADSLTLIIEESPHPVIVCGDFNDTPMSYSYHTIRGDLSDAFVEKGSGMPSTFKGLFNMFRIDYVLHSPQLRVLSYETPPARYSDHKPVVVAFDF